MSFRDLSVASSSKLLKIVIHDLSKANKFSWIMGNKKSKNYLRYLLVVYDILIYFVFFHNDNNLLSFYFNIKALNLISSDYFLLNYELFFKNTITKLASLPCEIG